MQFSNSAEKLLYGVLQKIIPAETLAHLQPDKLNALAQRLGGAISQFNIQQEDALTNQRVIMEHLGVGELYVNRAADRARTLLDGSGGGDSGSGGGSGDSSSGSADSLRAA